MLPQVNAEAVPELGAQTFLIPFVGVLVLGAEGADQPTDHAVHGVPDLFLLVLPFEQRATQPVDGLALLVHDVVVLEQVFAGLEVLGFPGLLRGLDALRDQLRLDGDALLHP